MKLKVGQLFQHRYTGRICEIEELYAKHGDARVAYRYRDTKRKTRGKYDFTEPFTKLNTTPRGIFLKRFTRV